MFVNFRLQQKKNEKTMETQLKCSGPRPAFIVFVPMFTHKVLFDFFVHFANFIALKKEKRSRAPCEDRTHDLQISATDYETDALPTALTRHLQILLQNQPS